MPVSLTEAVVTALANDAAPVVKEDEARVRRCVCPLRAWIQRVREPQRRLPQAPAPRVSARDRLAV